MDKLSANTKQATRTVLSWLLDDYAAEAGKALADRDHEAHAELAAECDSLQDEIQAIGW